MFARLRTRDEEKKVLGEKSREGKRIALQALWENVYRYQESILLKGM
jgi:hypothetical protein